MSGRGPPDVGLEQILDARAGQRHVAAVEADLLPAHQRRRAPRSTPSAASKGARTARPAAPARSGSRCRARGRCGPGRAPRGRGTRSPARPGCACRRSRSRWPTRIVLVACAIAAMGTNASRVSRVSATQIDSKPAASARCAIATISGTAGAPASRSPVRRHQAASASRSSLRRGKCERATASTSAAAVEQVLHVGRGAEDRQAGDPGDQEVHGDQRAPRVEAPGHDRGRPEEGGGDTRAAGSRGARGRIRAAGRAGVEHAGERGDQHAGDDQRAPAQAGAR